MIFKADDSDGDDLAAVPLLANAELVQLQIRVIALENLVIAMLADAPARQLDLVRENAIHILPRPGFTPHRLTIAAATEMNSLVERAIRFVPSHRQAAAEFGKRAGCTVFMPGREMVTRRDKAFGRTLSGCRRRTSPEVT